MSRADKTRTGACTKADARARLTQADAHLLVADLCLSDESNVATPSVAAAIAVLAAIAAADAACCHRLGRRSRAQAHDQAQVLLATIEPGGRAMAAKFGRIIAAKDESHYGLHLVTRSKAKALLRQASDLTEWSRGVLAS